MSNYTRLLDAIAKKNLQQMSLAIKDIMSTGDAGTTFLDDNFKTITDTTYTVVADDLGKVLRFTSSSAVTVTLPGGLDAGFNCLWRQIGAGKITFALAVTNPTQNLRNVDGYSKSSGQYAEGSLSLDSVTTDWFLSGSCGA